MSGASKKYQKVIHWFRKDLRLTDNTALHEAVSASVQVIPLYVLSTWKQEHRWTGKGRQEFLCQNLASLDANLQKKGGRLILRSGQALAEIEQLIREEKIEALYSNRDPDPFGQKQERELKKLCRKLSIDFHLYKDSALHERSEVLTAEGKPYRVYTPYYRNWIQLPKDSPRPLFRRIEVPSSTKSLPLPDLKHWGLSSSTMQLPIAGEAAARKRMKAVLAEKAVISYYDQNRDTPLLPPNDKLKQSTSRLSQDLRFGLISIRELYAQCQKAMQKARHKKGYEIYIKELAWREFYRNILHFFPEVLELEFNKKYRGLLWGQDIELLDRWKSGTTGFPIVDAGMRELAATGFMHNRVRMIVSMFLCKDLHLDWRLGESYFMQMLLDGEIASNNGGWQWSAGCGADAAPYFRIQNPWTQTKNYDPWGHYIKKWIPELVDIEPKFFQSPPPLGEMGQGLAPQYPPPMLDHAKEREVCLAMFKKQFNDSL